MRVVYLGGYGRSGSSLLDVALAGSDGVFSAGEFGILFHKLEQGADLCGCGEFYAECEVWGPLSRHVLELTGLEPAEAQRLTAATQMSRKPDRRYAVLWRTLVNSLAEHTASHTIIDSTKTARTAWLRPLRLRQAGIEIWPVHLVRDPAGVLASSSRGRNADLSRGVEQSRRAAVPALSWVAANVFMDLQSDLALEVPVTRVSYERFAAEPIDTIELLGKSLELDVSDAVRLISEGSPLEAGHGVGGNRMRTSGQIVVRAPEAGPDVPVLRRPLVGGLRQLGRRAGWLA